MYMCINAHVVVHVVLWRWVEPLEPQVAGRFNDLAFARFSAAGMCPLELNYSAAGCATARNRMATVLAPLACQRAFES